MAQEVIVHRHRGIFDGVLMHGCLAFAVWIWLVFLVPRFQMLLSGVLDSGGFPPDDFEVLVAASHFTVHYTLLIIPVAILFLWFDARVMRMLYRTERCFLASCWSLMISLLLISAFLFMGYAAASPGVMIGMARLHGA